MEITKELLEELYYEKQLSTRDISNVINKSQTQTRRILSKYNIQMRSSKEGMNTDTYKLKMQQYATFYKKEYVDRSKKQGKRIIKLCPNCKKEFETLKANPRTYCCKQCYLQHKKSSNKVKKNGKVTYKRVIKPGICQRCGSPTLNQWSKYCPECLSIVKHESCYKRIKTTCGYCGKELEVIPSVFKKNKYNYCNSECMAKHYSQLYTGENSPTWKGGKRHYFGNWADARRKARERDQYTCQLCGRKEDSNLQLSVHHIINYREFDNKYEANQLDNLTCLCHKCHTFVHSNDNTDKIFIKNKIQSNLTGDGENPEQSEPC